MAKIIFILFGFTIGVFAAKTMVWLMAHPGQTIIVMLLIVAASGVATLLRLMLGR